jgi:hypothetical protein
MLHLAHLLHFSIPPCRLGLTATDEVQAGPVGETTDLHRARGVDHPSLRNLRQAFVGPLRAASGRSGHGVDADASLLTLDHFIGW